MKTLNDFLFPFKVARPVQTDLMVGIAQALEAGKDVLAHAPTGLGKTAAAICPSLAHALEHDLSVLFLTARHAQHEIAVDTVRRISKKYDLDIVLADFVGKKEMCSLSKATKLPNMDLHQYCAALKRTRKCKYYTKAFGRSQELNHVAIEALTDLEKKSPAGFRTCLDVCTELGLCAYELQAKLAAKSRIVIADYFHVFHPFIQRSFFSRLDKDIGDCIVIVDEGHNLSSRLRSVLSESTSSHALELSAREATSVGSHELAAELAALSGALKRLGSKMNADESLIEEDVFESLGNIDWAIAELLKIAEVVWGSHERSHCAALLRFLEVWSSDQGGFAHICRKLGPEVELKCACLDPSVSSSEVINNARSTVIMSATMTPARMHADVLGFDRERLKVFKCDSPFPKENRLLLVIDNVTTKYEMRVDAEYERIASHLEDIISTVPRNSAIFFPSYEFQERVSRLLSVDKPIFKESPAMGKEEKSGLLEDFKKNSLKGSALLGVMGASFSEGIDLPGEQLLCVVIVGVPFSTPDVETRSLMRYYDQKFRLGWEYGYLFPAMNKAIQAAGRCIRSETDRGVVVFMDSRYLEPRCSDCFPSDMLLRRTRRPREDIKDFFGV